MRLQAAEARTFGRGRLAAKCDRWPARDNSCLTTSAWAHPSLGRKLDDLCASEMRYAYAMSAPARDPDWQQRKGNSECQILQPPALESAWSGSGSKDD